jgi:hypothetical protein
VPQSSKPGGWQEDAHTDVVHNYVDALSAFPQWGNADGAMPDLASSDGRP